MKIINVIHTFLPYSTGGSELTTYHLSKELSKRHELHIFHGINDSKRAEYEIRQRSFDGLSIHEINNSWKDCDSFEKTYKNDRIGEKFCGYVSDIKPDLVHFQHLSCLSTTLIEEVKKMGIPAVFTLHDYWPMCQRGQLFRKNLTICEGPLNSECAKCMAYQLDPKDGGPEAQIEKRNNHIKRQFSMIDAFIAPSKFAKQKYVQWGIPQEKITHCDFGLKPAECGLGKKPGKEIRFGYMGTLLPSKGIHVLIKSFNSIGPGANLKIYGKALPYHGYNDYLAQLQRMIVNPNIELMGEYDNKVVPEILSEIDVLIAPSIWYETSSITIKEALLSRTPVIASDTGGMAELIFSGQNGFLFPPGDFRALANRIRDFIYDPGLAERLSRNIAPPRSLDDSCRQLEGIYSNLINGKTILNQVIKQGVPKKLEPVSDEYDIDGFLGYGWYEVDTDGFRKWAWSKKDACINFPFDHKGFTLEIQNPAKKTVYIAVNFPHGSSNFTSDKPEIRVNLKKGAISATISVSQLWLWENGDRLIGVALSHIRGIKLYEEICPWPPSDYTIETSVLCNINPPCVMCPKVTPEGETFIRQETLAKFKTYLKYASIITFSGGGEPLLYEKLPDLLEDIGPVPFTTFNSNGLLLTKEKSEALISKGLKRINFSIDAAREDTYRKIRGNDLISLKENIKYLSSLKKQRQSAYPKVAVNMTLMKENLKELPEFVDLAREVGAQEVQISLLAPLYYNYTVQRNGFNFNYHEQMIDINSAGFKDTVSLAVSKAGALGIEFNSYLISRALNEIKEKDAIRHSQEINSADADTQAVPFCTRPWEGFMVDVSEVSRVCCHIRPVKDADNCTIGNLRHQSFEEIWNGPFLRKIRRQLLNNALPEECWACPFFAPNK
ncbi:MAG: glycosyltransferase [Candidatus Omnitrophota bacterium]|jgi:glycosyltransferase involved in cell wall biosynthesis/MoaA/NifB/PqqE/SkfB family radical SAM enzyme